MTSPYRLVVLSDSIWNSDGSPVIERDYKPITEKKTLAAARKALDRISYGHSSRWRHIRIQAADGTLYDREGA